MDSFFKNITGGDGAGKKKGGNRNGGRSGNDKQKPMQLKNPFANTEFQNPFSNLGKNASSSNPRASGIVGGGRLGGNTPGTLRTITIDHGGTLGVKMERTDHGGCIVSQVVSGSNAETAGLKRGDVVLVPVGGDSEGVEDTEEMKFEQFMALAKSDQRPLTIRIRRLPNISNKFDGANASPKEGLSTQAGSSAAADARREAVIAAAEARERAHKAKTRPRTAAKLSSSANNAAKKAPNFERKEDEGKGTALPMSAETQKALAAAKQSEALTAAKLGYNPYEVTKAGNKIAKQAIVTTTRGELNAGNASSSATSAGDAAPPPPPAVDRPELIDEAFDEAYAIVTSSNATEKAKSSVSIIKKLVVNATTKGQKAGEEGEKFRRVRLSNPKIKAAIVDVGGALDLVVSCGFELYEEPLGSPGSGGETYLVYPLDRSVPKWMDHAIDRMTSFEKGS